MLKEEKVITKIKKGFVIPDELLTEWQLYKEKF